jgi:dihydropteroate synthase
LSFAYRPGPPRGVSLRAQGAGAGFAIRPTGILHGGTAERAVADGIAAQLAGGPLAFSACELFMPGRDGVDIFAAAFRDAAAWIASEGGAGAASALARLSAPRRPFAGVPMDRPRLMGVVNVTPDSFSDGGRFLDAEAAIGHGLDLIEAGCEIIDIGGESTRPGAEPVPEAEELRRVVPVLRGLAGRGVAVSIDTRRPAVMRVAIEAGASIVNDVTALTADPGSLAVAAESGVSVVLMHMRGEPATMQRRPSYAHAPYEILEYLRSRVAACRVAGIPPSRIAVDPGIGFGKTPAHNAQLIAEAALFHDLGCAVVFGTSRKSFIARLSRGEPAPERLPGTLAMLAAAAAQGVQIHRVHDVAEARQALAILGEIMAY